MSHLKSENERQYQVIDQLMTAHAFLRDRYRRFALLLDLSLLSLSIGLNGFVFASDDTFRLLFFGHAAEAKLCIGLISVALLVVSIIQFRVDWEGQGRSHADALDRLGQLKVIHREAHSRGETDTLQAELTKEYARTMKLLPPVPERWFLRLKAHHKHKRLLSQEIDAHPGVPAWLLSLGLRWRVSRKAFCRKHQEP
jgi:hypothetical protein